MLRYLLIAEHECRLSTTVLSIATGAGHSQYSLEFRFSCFLGAFSCLLHSSTARKTQSTENSCQLHWYILLQSRGRTAASFFESGIVPPQRRTAALGKKKPSPWMPTSRDSAPTRLQLPFFFEERLKPGHSFTLDNMHRAEFG